MVVFGESIICPTRLFPIMRNNHGHTDTNTVTGPMGCVLKNEKTKGEKMPKKLNDKTGAEWFQMRTRDLLNGLGKMVELHESNDKESQITRKEWKALLKLCDALLHAWETYLTPARFPKGRMKAALKVSDDIREMIDDIKTLTLTDTQRANMKAKLDDINRQIAELQNQKANL
jgi:hypothetical protein